MPVDSLFRIFHNVTVLLGSYTTLTYYLPSVHSRNAPAA